MPGFWETVSASPEQTRVLGHRLGLLAGPGLLVLLAGELGAGKTCFAQGVAGGLGVPADHPVASPSYALLNIHPGRVPLYHFDLYRLPLVEDLEELGYDEEAERRGVTLIEWAERLAMPPPASLRVFLERLDDTRRAIRFEALDAPGRELVAVLAESANTL